MTLISILVYTLVILLASVTASILIKSKIKGKKAILSYILVGLITLFSLYLTVFNFMLNKPTENKTNSANTKVENVLPNRTDETKENFSKEGALEAATNMLKSFYADPSNKLSIDDRIKGIDKDKKLDGYVSDSAKSYLYLKDFMDKEEGYTTSAMAILAIIKNLTEIGNENLNPVSNDTQYVYLDETTRIAQVPIDYYTGVGGAVSMELVYVDGQWKLSPYSLLQSIQLANAKATQNSQ